MIFGRGGVGGAINRVTRQADWMRSRELSVQGGSWGYRRLTADLGHAINATAAARLTGVYENSRSYRTSVDIERAGFNPTVAFAVGPNTILRAGYEFFRDERTVDRGVPSFGGRPLETDPAAFFGSDLNRSRIAVNVVSSTVEHSFDERLTFRNRLLYADYDKFYGNLVPGAVNADASFVALTGYNSATQRRNVFNQTDLIASRQIGGIEHTLMTGLEVGRQATDNLRLTAFFSSIGPAATSVSVPIGAPTTSLPVEFRAAGSDANNHGVATVVATYVQDQIAFSPRVQAIVGLRYDRFNVELLDNRTGTQLASEDGLLSPRIALVYKPAAPLSLYASHTRSYLPRAGEQLASLSLTNRALDPENFRNYEVGAKWEATPVVSFTAAAYRLDHGNVVVLDAFDPTVSHLVDGDRTTGLELELSGNLFEGWSVHGGYALQDGEITRSQSAAVVAGARLAQVPRHSFSLWNKYAVSSRWGVGLGVISQSDRFVATDNRVVMPGFTRVDAATFFTISPQLRAHVNLENLFDERYYWAAHNNNNIAPGSPRAVRVSLTTQF
jgi:catecholate siderophore receptor